MTEQDKEKVRQWAEKQKAILANKGVQGYDIEAWYLRMMGVIENGINSNS
jgi:hypothetical protein